MIRTLIRTFAAAGCCAALLSATPSFAASQPAQAPAQAAHSSVVDLNHATVAELVALPGIGPSRADAIVKYRTEKGGFATVGEITEIKGIGQSLAKRLEPMLTVTPVKK